MSKQFELKLDAIEAVVVLSVLKWAIKSKALEHEGNGIPFINVESISKSVVEKIENKLR